MLRVRSSWRSFVHYQRYNVKTERLQCESNLIVNHDGIKTISDENSSVFKITQPRRTTYEYFVLLYNQKGMNYAKDTKNVTLLRHGAGP